MAYTRTVVITKRGPDYTVVIDETAEAATATEITLTTFPVVAGSVQLPYYGRVISRRSRLVSGSASTIDPILGQRSGQRLQDDLSHP